MYSKHLSSSADKQLGLVNRPWFKWLAIGLALLCIYALVGLFALLRARADQAPQTVHAGLGQRFEEVQATSSYFFQLSPGTRAGYSIQDTPIDFTYQDRHGVWTLPRAEVVWLQYPKDKVNWIFVIPQLEALTWEQTKSLSETLMQSLQRTQWPPMRVSAPAELEQLYRTSPDYFDHTYIFARYCDQGDFVELAARRVATAGVSDPGEPTPAQDLFTVSVTIEHLDMACN